VLALAGAAAALSAGVGFLPVLGARHHLDALTTGAGVSALAALAAVVQVRAGRDLDAGGRGPTTMTLGLGAAAVGFALGATLPGVIGLVTAALFIGWGVGVITPIGFATLAAGAPEGRLGQTMGAGEVGRELGDAGGPLVVGAFGAISLVAGMLGLAAVLAVTAKAHSMLGTERRAVDKVRRRRRDESPRDRGGSSLRD
jgi:hypothetical protein